MHVGHAHDHRPAGSAATRHWKPLAGALALTLGFMVVEVIGGLITGSLALLARAGSTQPSAWPLGRARRARPAST
jgi:cobalt-zinc-cadmium efflux system protein